MSLVVGFEADYTIHFALAYARSLQKTRTLRVRDALRDVGFSVTSGFVSTLGACLFMFFTVSSFFPEFAALVFVTLAFSFVLAILTLPAMLSLFGPESKCCCF